MISDKIIKTRCFSIENAGLEQVKTEVMQLDGVDSVSIDTNKLIISYDLRQINYQILKDTLTNATSIKAESIVSKLLSALICFREQNEIDHADSPAGWGYYVQNLYLGLHQNNRYKNYN